MREQSSRLLFASPGCPCIMPGRRQRTAPEACKLSLFAPKRPCRRRAVALGLAAALGAAASAAIVREAGAAGDVAKGHDLAVAYCACCHVVEEKNHFSGISSTPSFMLLVNALADWEDRFETFFARRPHPVHVRVKAIPPPTKLPPNATPFEIELDDVADLIAYARTLKK